MLITGGLFLLLTAVRNNEKVISVDEKTSQSLYQTEKLSNPLMILFSSLSSGFFTVPLGVLLFFSYRKTGEKSTSNLIFLNVIVVRILTALFKQLFKRKPPKWERVVDASKYGYPSAHVMNAASFYGLLLFLTGKWKSFWTAFGCLLFLMMIGLSRIKLGIHYTVDVIAGIAAGIFINLLSTVTIKRN
jgi:membrane-associated phospholipid phosphatase